MDIVCHIFLNYSIGAKLINVIRAAKDVLYDFKLDQ